MFIAFFVQGYIENKMAQEAIDLFFKLKSVDHVHYSLLFKACTELNNSTGYKYGHDVYSKLDRESLMSNDVLKSLSNMFIKYDDVDKAELIFEKLQRDVQSFGSLMKLYNKRNQPKKTIELFQRMKNESIEPNEKIFVLVLDSCSHIASICLSEAIAQEIPEHFQKNIWIRNSFIDMWVS